LVHPSITIPIIRIIDIRILVISHNLSVVISMNITINSHKP